MSDTTEYSNAHESAVSDPDENRRLLARLLHYSVPRNCNMPSLTSTSASIIANNSSRSAGCRRVGSCGAEVSRVCESLSRLRRQVSKRRSRRRWQASQPTHPARKQQSVSTVVPSDHLHGGEARLRRDSPLSSGITLSDRHRPPTGGIRYLTSAIFRGTPREWADLFPIDVCRRSRRLRWDAAGNCR